MKNYIKYFLIGTSFMGIILLLEFSGRYASEIFNKGIPISELFKLYIYTFLSFLGPLFAYGILLAAILTFKKSISQPSFNFIKSIKNGLILISIFSILFIAFTNWGQPKANIELRALLFDILQTREGQEMEKTDPELFKNSPSTETIFEINKNLNEYNLELINLRNKIDSLLNQLPDSLAKMNIEKYELQELELSAKHLESNIISEKEIRNSERKLRRQVDEYNKAHNIVFKYHQERNKRFSHLVFFIILFILGASMAYYYNDQKFFLLIILSFFTITFISGIDMALQKLLAEGFFDHIFSIVSLCMVVLICTSTFLFLGLKKSQQPFLK